MKHQSHQWKRIERRMRHSWMKVARRMRRRQRRAMRRFLKQQQYYCNHSQKERRAFALRQGFSGSGGFMLPERESWE